MATFPSQPDPILSAHPAGLEDTLAQRIKSRGAVATFAQKLNATHKISTLFPQHPPEEYNFDPHVSLVLFSQVFRTANLIGKWGR